MKIESNTRRVETNGIASQGQFTIKTSAQAFQLLSSGLYSNKVKAVIRELSCNAADAHKMTKNTAPIEIKIPNALDNQFYVKDYGPGLSHDQVMKLYTTYFESTKSDDNDMTGGFGLGSKSPFAYTDSFTVESIQNGKKNIYTAFVDDNNIPSIAHMGEQDTSEQDGLTVGFPVKPTDFKSFEKEALEVLRWFDTPAILKGTASTIEPALTKKNIAYATKNAVIRGHKFDVSVLGGKVGNSGRIEKLSNTNSYSTSKHSGKKASTVVMGNVAYPLVYNDAWDENNKINWLFNKDIIFTLPIGSISVAVSREELAYDRQSLKNIPPVLEQVFNDIASEIKKQMDQIWKSYSGLERDIKLEALLRYVDMEDSKIFEDFCKAVDLPADMKKALEPKYLYPDDTVPKTFNIVHLGWDAQASLMDSRHWRNAPQTKISTNKMPYFFENFGARFGKETATKLLMHTQKLSDIKSDSLYMIVPKEGKATTKEYGKELEEWTNRLGVKLMDVLPRTKIQEHEIMIPASLFARYSYHNNRADQVLTPETKDFIWIAREDLQNNKVGLSWHFEGMKKTLGLDNIPAIFIIESEYVKRIEELKNGTNIWNFLEQKIKEPKVIKKISKIQPMMDGYSDMFSKIRNRFRKEKDWQDILTGTKLGAWFKDMDRTKGCGSYDYSTVCWLQALKEKKPGLDLSIPAYYKGTDIESHLQEKYPLLLNKLMVKEKYVNNQALQSIALALQQYVAWSESNGVSFPPCASVLKCEDSPPEDLSSRP